MIPTCYCLPADQLGPGRPHQHLSMPDPCPHISRLDLIGAKLNDDAEMLDFIRNHLDICKG